MNKKKYSDMGYGFAISRKVLCLLLTCVLLMQSGCYTTQVMQSLAREELKTDKHKPLILKKGQLIRITYMDGSNKKTKRLIGRVQSITPDALIVTYNPGFRDKENSISFQYIQKIELIEKKMSNAGFVVTPIVVLSTLGSVLYFIALCSALSES